MTTNTKTTIKTEFANDLGYGSVKARINNHSYIVPSTIAKLRQQDVYQPTTFKNPAQMQNYMDDFMDHLDVSVQSAQVQETSRVFVGKNAVRSRLSKENFNVNNYQGKAENDLSLILTLSIIAGEAVKDSYQDLSNDEKNTLTKYPYKDVYTTVDMSTALPVTEGKVPNKIEQYAAKFYNNGNEHLVILHNFEQLITVHITFNQPIVALEGETALYKIRHANSSLAQLIKDDFDKAYPEYKDKVTPGKLINRPQSLTIDIGEGTVDIVAFTNGKINEHASISLKQGYGNALESAILELQQKGINVTNRTDLQQQLNEPEDIFNARLLNIKRQAVHNQLEPFEKEIAHSFSEALRMAGSNTEIVYVLGGGAEPMKKYSSLRQSLINEAKAQTGNIGVFVIFIDPRYAQLLNESGLQLILDRVKSAQED